MITDEINALVQEAQKPPKECSTRWVINQFQGDERTAVIALIDNKAVPAERVVALLAKHGQELRASLVNKHRRRLNNTGCGCPVDL